MAAAEGSERAVRELLDRYQRPIFSLVYRLVRDRMAAEDLAQEAFVRAFTAMDSYDPSRRFSSWIFKIAHNHAIDHLRKRRVETVSLDGAPDATGAQEQERTRIRLADTGEMPDEFVENRELASQLETAIGALRPEYQTVVLMRHVEGYPYQEIADVMELPLGTVKTYLHRARAELKDALEELVA
jgi:RNA polymerase sigma-70 factor (ECF subfamily)